MYNHRVRYVFVFKTDKESLTTIRYALGGCNECSNKMCRTTHLVRTLVHIYLNRNNKKSIRTFENPK
jgi:uncharacterized membrane-anchored protein